MTTVPSWGRQRWTRRPCANQAPARTSSPACLPRSSKQRSEKTERGTSVYEYTTRLPPCQAFRNNIETPHATLTRQRECVILWMPHKHNDIATLPEHRGHSARPPGPACRHRDCRVRREPACPASAVETEPALSARFVWHFPSPHRRPVNHATLFPATCLVSMTANCGAPCRVHSVQARQIGEGGHEH